MPKNYDMDTFIRRYTSLFSIKINKEHLDDILQEMIKVNKRKKRPNKN